MRRERTANVFTHVPEPNVKRNTFDLSHEVKMSGKFGILYPCMITEALPGDVFYHKNEVLTRFAPMLAPVMHRCDVSIHSFFVPNRIIWDAWETFITGGQDGTAAPVPPYTTPSYIRSVDENAQAPGSLLDYLGYPVKSDTNVANTEERISTLPLRAYWKIWNDYYRDPNLQNEFPDRKAISGVDNHAGYFTWWENARRGYEKDYFTAALPWPQRGPQVLIPFDTTITDQDIDYLDSAYFFKEGTNNPAASGNISFPPVPPGAPGTAADSDGDNLGIENIEEISVTNASITINDLRRSFALQRWLENNARGGGRYTEQLQGHFGVRVPDYRVQRAEYLGGFKQPVQISEVLATADDGDSTPVGDMAGHGVAAGKSNGWSYRCEEHGFIISILSVTFRTAYSQGLHKMWSRRDKFDYAWPELANLGEQELKSKELFFNYVANDANNESTFGYVPRYAEYKYVPDRIAGDFRTSLMYWHLGRRFLSRPVLDTGFTSLYEHNETQATSRRIFAVQDGTDYLWMQIYHRLKVSRALPYFGVPSGLS